MKKRVLMLASVASMIDQFNMPNIRLLIEAGCQVHVLCNFEEGNTCDDRRIEELKTALDKMGVFWHQWDCPRNFRSVRQCVRAYRQLWKLTGQYHFAWMHCHSPIGGVLARVAAHWRKTAVIYTAHGFHFFKGAPPLNWLLYYPAEKLLSYWTDVLVTVNREDYRFAKQHMRAGRVCFIPGIGIDLGRFQVGEGCAAMSIGVGSGRIRREKGCAASCIGTDNGRVRAEKGCVASRMGIDAGRLQAEKTCLETDIGTNAGKSEKPADGAAGAVPDDAGRKMEIRRKYQIPENAMLLLSVGELSRRKNHQAVIRALAQTGRTDIYYMICGQGALKETLEQQARRLGVADRVILTGFRQDVAVLYLIADLFVFPSLQEGMPVALMEAMAAGLPCVVSDVRGNRELIDRQGGIKFPVSDVMQLKKGILYFLDRPKERALCGRHNQSVAKGYGVEVVQSRMRIIYADMDKYLSKASAEYLSQYISKNLSENLSENLSKNSNGQHIRGYCYL